MNPPKAFLPGKELARHFYAEVVAPLLAEGFPGLRYSAGILGSGSEVLGFDTPQSTDHHWGPRVMVFVEPGQAEVIKDVPEWLSHRLPPQFLGWSTHWGPPDAIGVRLLVAADGTHPIAHRVEVMEAQEYLNGYLGVDPWQPLSDEQWLVPGDQKLRTLRDGALFRDDLGLGPVLKNLAWYPEPVWREKMARLWDAIADEEPFLGRCGDVGDERGSRLVAARLVDQALHLAFFQEKDFPPYSKWFGTALTRLSSAAVIGPWADAVLGADTWRSREVAFNGLCSELALAHNALGLTDPLPSEASPFWGRPYRVIHGDRFAAALRRATQEM